MIQSQQSKPPQNHVHVYVLLNILIRFIKDANVATKWKLGINQRIRQYDL